MRCSFRVDSYFHLRVVQIQVSVTKNYSPGVFADFHNLFYKVVHNGVAFAHDSHIYYVRSGNNIPKKWEPNRIDRFHGKISRRPVSLYCDLLYWNTAILLAVAHKIYSISRQGSIRSRHHMTNAFNVFPLALRGYSSIDCFRRGSCPRGSRLALGSGSFLPWADSPSPAGPSRTKQIEPVRRRRG